MQPDLPMLERSNAAYFWVGPYSAYLAMAETRHCYRLTCFMKAQHFYLEAEIQKKFTF